VLFIFVLMVDRQPTEMSAGDNNYALTVTGNETAIADDRWIFDSVATSHMTPNRSSVENSCPINQVVTVGGGYQLQETEIGPAKLTTLLSDGTT
jgi:hypothetical protein